MNDTLLLQQPSAVTPTDLLDQVYQTIKGLEEQFPIPTPVATVTVGTFNAATGAFNGLKSTLERIDVFDDGVEDPMLPHPKPPLVPVPPEIEVNAVNVNLQFSITRPHGAWRVTANGVQVAATTNQDTITVNVGKASLIAWSVQSGTRKYQDKLIINRPPIIGAGAFKIPALPVSVIYEPPSRPQADRQPNNAASYAVTTAIGTSTSVSFSTENSTTTPVPTQFEALDVITGILDGLSAAADALGPIVAGKIKVKNKETGKLEDKEITFDDIGGMFEGISSTITLLFGEASATLTSGTTVTNEKTLAIVNSVGTSVSTGTNDGGPGIGDLIYFLRNARLAWVASNGEIKLALLGHEGVAFRTAGFLGANLDTGDAGISRETAETLLALDPFVVGGPNAALPAPRFVPITTIELNGVAFTQTVSRTISQTDLQATVNTKTRTEDFNAGLLAFAGIGVTEDQTVTSTTTQRNAASTTQTQTVAVSMELHADSDELYAIAVSYDRVFGTFAFQPAPLLKEAVVAGSARTSAGQPLARQPVTLQAQGQTFITHTDEQGRWAFHTPQIKPGALTLALGQISQTLPFTGQPIRNLELR